ncbi:hypothetical protein CCR91_13685 [Thiorhodovibrio winogradskyi]|nr:hypothetical protein [Thiorhodovibrio winogradskyi]
MNNRCFMKTNVRLRSARGVTMVELLVGMTIGLFLTGGIIALLLGTKQSYRSNEALSEVQENGRFATELLAQQLRMAGSLGCQRSLMLQNTAATQNPLMHDFEARPLRLYNTLALVSDPEPTPLTPTSSEDVGYLWLYNLNDRPAVEGFEGEGTSFAASSSHPTNLPISTILSGLSVSEAETGQDMVTIRGINGRGVPVIGQASPSVVGNTDGSLYVLGIEGDDDEYDDDDDCVFFRATSNSAAISLCIGQIEVVSTCENATIFQISDVNRNTPCDGVHEIKFEALSPSNEDFWEPGNYDYRNGVNNNVDLGVLYSPETNPCPAPTGNARKALITSAPASIYSLDTRIYYIRNNSENLPALYIKEGLRNSEQLISGVFNLAMYYGDNVNAEGMSTREPSIGSYVEADQVADWREINAVKFYMLAANTAPELSNAVDEPMKITFPDIDTAGNPFDATSLSTDFQRRFFQSFSTTVYLRNKLPFDP